MSHWKSAMQILLRGIAHNKVRNVQPVTVVEDGPAHLFVYLAPGTPRKIPAELIKRKYSGENNQGSRWDDQDSGNWELRDWVWNKRHVLIAL